MVIENLESRNLLAGDNTEYESADILGSIVGVVGMGAMGGVCGYLWPTILGELRGAAAGTALGVLGGGVIGGGLTVAGEAIASGVTAASETISDMVYGSQDEALAERGMDAWVSSDHVFRGTVGSAFCGGLIGFFGGLVVGHHIAEAEACWDLNAPETQNRILLGAALGAGIQVAEIAAEIAYTEA